MGAAGKLLVVTLVVMSSTAAEESQDHSSHKRHAVNSLNKLLDYMLQPRSVVGDMIFGVVMARGSPKYLKVSLHFVRNTGYTHITHFFL